MNDEYRALYAEVTGRVITALRGRRTMAHLAERSGISKSSLSRIECGDQVMSVWQARKMASALGLTLAQLADRIEFEYQRALVSDNERKCGEAISKC